VPRSGLTRRTSSPSVRNPLWYQRAQTLYRHRYGFDDPVGSDVSAGTYRCTNCNYDLGVQSVKSLPPCPKCDGPYGWKMLTGGDAKGDPYPDEA